MKLLICGGRDFTDYYALDLALKSLFTPPSIIIEGDAPGADKLAGRWAKANGIHYARVEALWDYYKKPAGPKRNAAMLLLQPDMCLAMPGDVGTKDMISQCRDAGIPVWIPYNF